MADKEEKTTSMIEKKLDYIVEAIYDIDIQRHGYAVALKRRHEIIGDKNADFAKLFEEVDTE